MNKEKKRLLLLFVPVFTALIGTSVRDLPVSGDVRAALMGLCIGISLVTLAKSISLVRAERC